MGDMERTYPDTRTADEIVASWDDPEVAATLHHVRGSDDNWYWRHNGWVGPH